MNWIEIYEYVKDYGPNHVVYFHNPPNINFNDLYVLPRSNPHALMPDGFYRKISFTVEQIEFIAKSLAK